jgi:hypothetical protein
MERKNRMIVGVLLAGSLAGAVAAHAGYRLTDERGMQTEISKGRMKQSGNAPVQSSLDMTSGRIWMANPEKKIFWEGPIDEFCGQMKQAVSSMQDAMKASMEAHMKDMSPDQKAKMEAMVKGLGGGADTKPPETKMVKTEETETIAGMPTRKIQLLVDGQVSSEYWVTTDPSITKELRLDKAAATMTKFRGCQSNAKGLNQMSAMQDVFSQGFPLKTTTYGRGKSLFVQSYSKVETVDLPDAGFAPPEGFRKVTLQEAMFAGAGEAKAGPLKRGVTKP